MGLVTFRTPTGGFATVRFLSRGFDDNHFEMRLDGHEGRIGQRDGEAPRSLSEHFTDVDAERGIGAYRAAEQADYDRWLAARPDLAALIAAR